MAFLDNSGDIILDAVLTDTGRARLAKGDGSFKITKFALGDDEIDYTSFDGNNASGSAYYDLEILQTPIFEAFTNNAASMKSKLISLTNNNLLYLPIMKLNKEANAFKPTTEGLSTYGSGSHVFMVDTETVNQVNTNNSGIPVGVLNAAGGDNTRRLRTDQGINSTELSADLSLDPELKETQYIVEIDNRFGKVYDAVSGDTTPANPAFIDDDSIASYYITQNIGSYIRDSRAGNTDSAKGTINAKAQEFNESIAGPRGTTLQFGILASMDLVSSTYLFTTIGSTINDGTTAYYFIDSTIKVTGVTTGYRLDIPVRFLKKQ
tara:strand:- start:1483 stop:2445 length:963 start_codon:yes stop_codon:yes gene_type:complete